MSHQPVSETQPAPEPTDSASSSLLSLASTTGSLLAHDGRALALGVLAAMVPVVLLIAIVAIL